MSRMERDLRDCWCLTPQWIGQGDIYLLLVLQQGPHHNQVPSLPSVGDPDLTVSSEKTTPHLYLQSHSDSGSLQDIEAAWGSRATALQELQEMVGGHGREGRETRVHRIHHDGQSQFGKQRQKQKAEAWSLSAPYLETRKWLVSIFLTGSWKSTTTTYGLVCNCHHESLLAFVSPKTFVKKTMWARILLLKLELCIESIPRNIYWMNEWVKACLGSYFCSLMEHRSRAELLKQPIGIVD